MSKFSHNTAKTKIEALEARKETGGTSWQPLTEYYDGDIIMSDAAGPGLWEQYYCQNNHTSAGSFNTDIANWTAIDAGSSSGGYVSDTGKALYIPDCDNGDYFEYTLTQNTTIGAINSSPGNTGTIQINQDTLGFWTNTWDSSYTFPAGLPMENINPNAYNIFKYTISGSKVFVEYLLDGI